MNISGYTIESRIGAGGQAMVYYAIQESLQRPVALKVLNPLLSDSPEFTARFLNEGRMLANLGHSNVITIHDIGAQGSFHYISMELVEGGDLKRRMKKPMEPVTALGYVRTIADCLATAHERSVVHRDIKPANVLFRMDGTLLLTDFGIAKQLDGDSDLTLTGTTVGSPHYLSPEQAQCQILDGRADIYSLGIMAFEMLVGEKPFVGDSEVDTIFMHIHDPVPRLPEHLSAYQELIDRMIAKRSADRFENARALMAFIDRLIAAPSTSAPAELEPPRGEDAASEEQQPSADVDDQDDVATIFVLHQGRDDDAETEVNLKPTSTGSTSRRLRIPVLAACLVAGAAFAWPLFEESQAPVTTTSAMPLRTSQALPPASVEQPQRADAVAPASRARGTDSTAHVGSLLTSANQALDDFRLTKPVGNNALEYFNQVLALDPANSVAGDGHRRIAERYGVLVRGEIRRENYSRASDFVDQGLSLEAQNPQLLALRQQIDKVVAEKAVANSVMASKVVAERRLSRSEPADSEVEASGEIKGEPPSVLFNRIKGWLN